MYSLDSFLPYNNTMTEENKKKNPLPPKLRGDPIDYGSNVKEKRTLIVYHRVGDLSSTF